MTLFQKHSDQKLCPAAGRLLQRHRGMMLIEVMVSILILVIGVLGLMAAFAKTTTTQTDVDNRAIAARLTQSLLNQIAIGVNRENFPLPDSVLPASLTPLAHYSSPAPVAGVPAPCTGGFSGAASADPMVTNWLAQVTGPGGLPGATAAMQQIFVDTTFNQVTVTVCWQSPGDLVPRQHVQRAYIN
jgi:type IV pilus assembly protein PilV